MHVRAGFLIAAMMAVCLFASPGSAAEGENYNVILISIDDMGWADPGFMGNTYHQTPNMDFLAEKGISFSNAYALPNCSPARSSMYTGRHPTHHKVYTVPMNIGKSFEGKLPSTTERFLDSNMTTLFDIFRANGYKTANIGKFHVGEEPSEYGVETNIAGGRAGKVGTYFGESMNGMMPKSPDEYMTDRLGKEARKLVRQWSREPEPFLIALNHYAVHGPLEAPEKLVEKYRRRDPSKTEDEAIYAAMLDRVDDTIGRLYNTIKRLGLRTNTIIIITSDNGSAEGNYPLRGIKGQLLEGGMRVPMVFWAPKLFPDRGGSCNIPFAYVDLLPTLLALTGIEADIKMDGMDFSAIMRDPGFSGRCNCVVETDTSVIEQEPLRPCVNGAEQDVRRSYREARRPLYFHLPAYVIPFVDGKRKLIQRPASAIRRAQWKLVEYLDDCSVELFDVVNDIAEENDVASQNAEVVVTLRTELEDWRRNEQAEIPFGNEKCGGFAVSGSCIGNVPPCEENRRRSIYDGEEMALEEEMLDVSPDGDFDFD